MKKSIMRFIILVFFFMTVVVCSAQTENSENDSKAKPPTLVKDTTPAKKTTPDPDEEIYKINPTRDENDSSKLYIPKDLDDSFVELNKMLHPKFIDKFKTGGKDERNRQHFGLGLWMRNNWGLWAGSRLAKYFRELGINHPDDMSGIILTSYQRHLNKEPLELEEQIRFYKEYWEKQKP